MKKLLSLILSLLLVLSFAGCTEKTPESDTGQANPPTVSEDKKDAVLIKKGLWQAEKDGAVLGYYYFSENGAECKYKDAELLGGTPFDYEISGEGYIFHIGSADDNTPVNIKEKSAENAVSLTLVFPDREEQIKYIKNCTIEEYFENQK